MVEYADITGQVKQCFHFTKRAVSDREMMPQFRFPLSPLAFGDIAWNGDSGPSDLAGQTKALFVRPGPRNLINCARQPHPLLPGIEFPIRLNPPLCRDVLHDCVPSRLLDSFTPRLLDSPAPSYTHHASVADSRITTSFRKSTALVNPSLTLISESSCSIEMTPS